MREYTTEEQNQIADAAYEIGDFCSKWGRIGAQSKEKYNTVRVYISFGVYDFFGLINPSHVWRGRWPNWANWLDYNLGCHVVRYSGIEWLFSKWQPIVYNWAYQRALKKYPHLRYEILNSADYWELIKGASRVEGNKTHILGVNGEILSTWSSGE